MDKVLKRKKDDSMYDSRYIELEKLMNIINKLNKELQLVKKDINNKESKSKELVSYIEQKIKENTKSIKDIEEMNGHFKMFNYVMKCMEKPLSEDIIKNMHKNLKEGVFEDRANGYAIGGWRKRANRVSDIQTALPQEVPEKIHQLLEKYHNAEKITLYDIAKFHAQFENIHPFQDGNGRVGRMIILKQCLDHNIVPVIIRDIHKAEYNRYLNKAQHEQDYKGLEAYFEKEQKYYQESTIPMIFDFDEL